MSATPPTPLSVVILAWNEARCIGACVGSARLVSDDIVVVDSGSMDGTQEICRRAGARVFERPWPGYSAQKNFGNEQARHDWILSLDADERLTPELAASIRREFAGAPQADAYEFRFHSFVGARCVRFGAWNPEYHVRIFNRRQARWNRDEVHEGLIGIEQVSRLEGAVLHFTAADAGRLAEKAERYGALFAEKMRRSGKRVSWWKVWLNPGLRFVRDYLLRLGVLDGTVGLAIAWQSARYTHIKYRGAYVAPSMGRWIPVAASCVVIASLALLPRSPRSLFPGESRLQLPPASAASASFGQDDDAIVPIPPIVDDDDDVAT